MHEECYQKGFFMDFRCFKETYYMKFVFCNSKNFLFMLLIVSFVTSDEIDVNSTYLANDTYENLTIFYQNISDLNIYNETTINNVSNVDVATELESSISVTEDSDTSFQSESSKNLFVFLTPDEDICNCDLTSIACDINCCCDPDCNEEDMQVFSECSHQVLTPDENYCFQQDIILRNNTVYKMVKNPYNGMFCIHHDNFKHRLRFKDMPVLKSHKDLTTVLKYKYKTTYSWDTESDIAFDSSELRDGSPIYIDVTLNKKTGTNKWSLPSSCLSDICSCEEEVRYLRNFQSSCSYTVNDLKAECDSSNILLSADKFTDFCISLRSSPSLAANTLADLVVHTKMVNASLSEDDSYHPSQDKLCMSKNSKRPEKTSDSCQNVVTHINFTVEQDGSNGVTAIKVEFRYANISFDRKTITQTYSVNFVWSNVSDDIQKRSGNPGYQIGLPILAATNGSELDSGDISTTFFEKGLSVLDKDSKSVCSSDRRGIKFGYNLKTGCILKHHFTSCKNLQARVSEILLGRSKRQIFVGSFGNANISNPDDWIEVFHEANDPPDSGENCFASLGLKIDIVYAAVGSVANPQYKIVGVSYHDAKPEFVSLACSSSCSISLWTSVSFFDVTLSAVEHYAKVPSIKANLPSDFFYPFLYGRSTRNVNSFYLVYVLFCILYVISTRNL